jgi:voltage-gated potassium channel Kch
MMIGRIIFMNGLHLRTFCLAFACVVCFALILTVACSDAKKHFKGMDNEDDNDTILSKFGNRLYFAAVSISTLGYGDISPTSTLSRGLTVTMVLFSISALLTNLAHAP